MDNSKSVFVDGFYCRTEIAQILRHKKTSEIKEIIESMNLETRIVRNPVNVSGNDKVVFLRSKTEYYVTQEDLEKIKGSLHER